MKTKTQLLLQEKEMKQTKNTTTLKNMPIYSCNLEEYIVVTFYNTRYLY